MAKNTVQKHTAFDPNDYAQLLKSNVINSVVATGGARFDSAEDASMFFARELDYVKGQSYDVEHPELTGLNIFPQTSEADPGAETVTFYTYDKTGMAKIISNYATDLPRADVYGKPTTVPIKSIGDSYGYSVQEMRASKMAGKSLDVRKAESARYAIDRAVNNIVWAGDSDSGLMGVLTKTNDIPLYTLPKAAAKTTSTKWVDKTAEEILADVTGMQKQVSFATKNVERPDTLVLPTDVYLDISNRQIPNTGLTVLSFIKANAPYIKEIVAAAELNSDSTETNPYAAISDGQGVALLFSNDAKKMAVENPLPFYQYPLQPEKLEVVVPCEARTAGVIIYYPLSALIAVGL